LTNCDYVSHFNAHSIIFDLTLCVGLSHLSRMKVR
jgi:hypothetical protein